MDNLMILGLFLLMSSTLNLSGCVDQDSALNLTERNFAGERKQRGKMKKKMFDVKIFLFSLFFLSLFQTLNISVLSLFQIVTFPVRTILADPIFPNFAALKCVYVHFFMESFLSIGEKLELSHFTRPTLSQCYSLKIRRWMNFMGFENADRRIPRL